MKTFDIHFNDNENSNNMGFNESLDYCKDYITRRNGCGLSYFADYKGGTVSIVDNATGEEVYSEEVR